MLAMMMILNYIPHLNLNVNVVTLCVIMKTQLVTLCHK